MMATDKLHHTCIIDVSLITHEIGSRSAPGEPALLASS
jgi:hypothetical protein